MEYHETRIEMCHLLVKKGLLHLWCFAPQGIHLKMLIKLDLLKNICILYCGIVSDEQF